MPLFTIASLDATVVCYDCGDDVQRRYVYLYESEDYCEACYDLLPYCDYCDEVGHDQSGCDNGPADHVYGDYYKPKPVFHGTGPLFMGVEMEITANDKSATILYDHFGGTEQEWFVKEDGSVYDGWEFVSHPRDLASWQEHDYSWIQKLLDGGGATLDHAPESSHGFHVHLSRAGFRDGMHLARFYSLITDEGNRKFTEHMAGRRANSWAIFDHPRDEYTSSWMRQREPAIQSRRRVAQNGTCGFRYSVLNLTNRETVEFRLGCATLRRERILSVLEFLHAAVEWSRLLNRKMEAIGGGEWQALVLWASDKPEYANFINHVVSGPKAYRLGIGNLAARRAFVGQNRRSLATV